MGSAQAAPCLGVTFGAAFDGSYNCNDLGTPGGMVPNMGGITFLNNDTLLVGNYANGPGGTIRQIDVIRDADNHIIGFSGASQPYATASYIDGGLTFGPGGVLFATGYPNNTLLQYKPGSTTPDKIINLSDFGVTVGDSVGTLAFVPLGFDGAGQLKIASFSYGFWYTATLTEDGNGLYDLAVVWDLAFGRSTEGIAYVAGQNPGFGGLDSVLLSEYGAGKVAAYQIDANGNPIIASRQDFLSGLRGAREL
ncbi:hypothetical protein [Govanella unica]|uniref:Uncharacterized protein n=1 Tax=Govanella unica TaxID=2975056 RepID=A0A9X3Z6R0_9PROT|nr:hypothetical protein [Govania unica]MDA5193396.1 hypothetical protein [Govania unica]